MHGAGIFFGNPAHIVIKVRYILVAPGIVDDADWDGERIGSERFHHLTVTSQHRLRTLALVEHRLDHPPTCKDLSQSGVILAREVVGAVEVLDRVPVADIHLPAGVRSAIVKSTAAPGSVNAIVVWQTELFEHLRADSGADIVTAKTDVFGGMPDRVKIQAAEAFQATASGHQGLHHFELNAGQQVEQGVGGLRIVVETGIEQVGIQQVLQIVEGSADIDAGQVYIGWEIPGKKPHPAQVFRHDPVHDSGTSQVIYLPEIFNRMFQHAGGLVGIPAPVDLATKHRGNRQVPLGDAHDRDVVIRQQAQGAFDPGQVGFELVFSALQLPANGMLGPGGALHPEEDGQVVNRLVVEYTPVYVFTTFNFVMIYREITCHCGLPECLRNLIRINNRALIVLKDL